MKKILISVATLLVVSGCATLKTPQINGTNRNEGLVDLSYSYGLFERPQVNWEQAELTTATQQCQSWGYQKPSANSDPWQECASTDSRGNCNSHIVTKRYQCGFSNQQIAARNEANRAAEEEFAKNYPYTATLKCVAGNDVLQTVACLITPNGGHTKIELTNGSEYNLVTPYDSLEKIGKETKDGLIINLRKHFKLTIQNSGQDPFKLTLIVKKTATGEKTYERSVIGFDSITLVN